MIEITSKPIDVNQLLTLASDPECGAQVMFVGTTRQWTGDVETDYLEYEAYEQLAMQKMKELESLACERWPLRKVAIVHRIGRVDVMEPSVAVVVSCPHRSEAFEAAKWLIDELKHRVPIWKREHYVQHGSQWIHPTAGSCSCDHLEPNAAMKSNAAQLNQQQQAAQQ